MTRRYAKDTRGWKQTPIFGAENFPAPKKISWQLDSVAFAAEFLLPL